LSRRVVLDASAAIEAVLLGARARAVLDVLAGASLVVAPELYSCEVANALWKYVQAGEVDPDEAASLLETALELVDALVPDHEVSTEALMAAISAGQPVYDLCYAVLARRHGCSVCTLDARFTRTLDGMGIEAIALPTVR